MSIIPQLQQLEGPSLQQLQLMYQQTKFPMEVRYYCAQWIEAQQWANIDTDSGCSEPAANMLLQQLVQQINEKSEELTGDDMFVIRLKLGDIANELLKTYQNDPLKFVRVVRHCLESEKRILTQASNGMQGAMASAILVPDSHNEIESVLQTLKYKTQEQEKLVNDMKQKQELFVVKYQDMVRNLQTHNMYLQQQYPQDNANRQAEEARLNQKKIETEQILQAEAQELLAMRINLATQHQETFVQLSKIQSQVLEDELVQWKRRQQLVGIGGSPEGSLDTVQAWCESLAEVTWQNRQQTQRIELLKQQLPMKSQTENVPDHSTSFTALLSALVTTTFIIEKQPPQVLKKETRFSASVRLLVGGKLNVHMNPPQVKATIISEAQAKALMHNENSSLNDTSGDILNNCGVMEFHKDSGVLNVNFRNMSLKRIKRADRRGAEFVTEEKFTILFQSHFRVASGELVFQVRTISLPVVVVSHGNQECNALSTILWDNAFGDCSSTLSLPVVVIVHGNQESNALATVLWDNAFAQPGRIPFVIPDKVPWPSMADALNSKFASANGRSLSSEDLQYLAMKAFGSQNVQTDDFSNMYITWSTFNRDPLPGCPFTFWRWFHGVLELTRKYLRALWNEGSIVGFIRKEKAQEILLTKQSGTFLLRFSDSKIGAISITWVNEDPSTGDRQVLNLHPFSGEDFQIRCLADRIHDLPHLTHLFPDIPKDTAFGQFYTPVSEELPQVGGGYVSSVLVSKIPQLSTPQYAMDNPATPSGSVEPLSPQQPLENQPNYSSFGGFSEMLDYDQDDYPSMEPIMDMDDILKDLFPPTT